MATIITGNFQHQDDARRAWSDLLGAGFGADQMTTFFVNPPGQHDLYPIGGDEDESPGTENAAAGAASGAAFGGAIGVAVGIATLPVLGPVAPAAGAGVGAYVGSLYGALSNTDDNNPETQSGHEELRRNEPPRRSGMLVAVSAPSSEQQETAIRILRARRHRHRTHRGQHRCGGMDRFQPVDAIEAGGGLIFAHRHITDVA